MLKALQTIAAGKSLFTPGQVFDPAKAGIDEAGAVRLVRAGSAEPAVDEGAQVTPLSDGQRATLQGAVAMLTDDDFTKGGSLRAASLKGLAEVIGFAPPEDELATALAARAEP